MDADVKPLSGEALQAVTQVRARMDAAHCVFDFTVRGVADGHEVTEADHRAVLRGLFDELQAQARERRAAWIAAKPELADQAFWMHEDDVARARPTPWAAECVIDAAAFRPGQRIAATRDVSTVSPFEWLAQAFDDPPYGAQCGPGLFADFCDAVGLRPGEGIVVLDWVGDPEREPDRSAWSDYFDAGREWWGIWCLTVWNPRRRTLAALAASATD